MNLHREVNSGMAIFIISALAFLTVLYYFTHTADAIGKNLVKISTRDIESVPHKPSPSVGDTK